MPRAQVEDLGGSLLVDVEAVARVDKQTSHLSLYGRSASAKEKLRMELARALQSPNVESSAAFLPKLDPDFSDPSSYSAGVSSTIDRILAGDLFQANLTREITMEWVGASRGDAIALAFHYVNSSGARFGAVVPDGNRIIASASPERFFKAVPTSEGVQLIAEPIKGTRPRHPDPVLDTQLADDLVNSVKDRAENVMIADLVRNDLSKVCTDDSVRVEALCELQSNTSVHHLVTRIVGTLRSERSVVDALAAQFPCGSITGAPKLAAMDLIRELEQRPRGIYCGAIGYLDDRGHADFSVPIRTAVFRVHDTGVTITYGTGGGITTLSDPLAEWEETEDKAAGFYRALGL